MTNLAPTVKLSDGTSMPQIGLGTYLALDNDVYEAVKAAIDIGYRHFDTAWLYQNEDQVGRAIREKIAEGKVRREDVYVTTKVWPTFFGRGQVVPACKKSLEALGLEFIDQYLFHWPMGMKYSKVTDNPLENIEQDETKSYLEAYKELEECVRLGYVKSIGLSNFNSKQIDEILGVASIRPVVNQVECHVQLNQKQLIAFCRERGIVVTAYCPLSRPDPAKKEPVFIYSEKTAKIGQKYGKTASQVALRYLVEIGAVPLPKSTNPKRIRENFEIFDFKLTADDIKVLEGFGTKRIVPWEDFAGHKDYPFNIEF